MYYLQKQGVYGHGVFWIGADLEKGKIAAQIAADGDKDAYHDWVLIKYHEPTKLTNYIEDSEEDVVYTALRVDQEGR